MIRVSEDGKLRRDGSVAMYSQLRQSLIQLQEAADRIFDTISVRITEEREKLGNISARIENAKGKIDAMSCSNHPLMIHSPSTYPSKSTGEVDYHPLFSYRDGPDSAGFPVGKLLVNGGLNREFGIDGTLELFRFFTETSFESLPKEVCSKVSDGASHLKSLTNSVHLLVPPKIPNDSFLAKDHPSSDSKCKPESQSLPPPPPSLLMHNSQLPPRPEKFSFRPAVKQLQSLMLSDIQPDLATVSNSASSGVHFPSKTSEDHSHEAGSSMLVAGRGTIHQPTDCSHPLHCQTCDGLRLPRSTYSICRSFINVRVGQYRF